jgi:Soluble NSF attachment protein, SNAP
MSLLASTQRKKALDLVAQAEAMANKRSWFGKERNQEDAAELYAQAANAYKVGGFGHEAGTTYSQAGAMYRDQVKNPSEASKCYSQAGTCVAVKVCACGKSVRFGKYKKDGFFRLSRVTIGSCSMRQV